jgi:hypothetical protein
MTVARREGLHDDDSPSNLPTVTLDGGAGQRLLAWARHADRRGPQARPRRVSRLGGPNDPVGETDRARQTAVQQAMPPWLLHVATCL